MVAIKLLDFAVTCLPQPHTGSSRIITTYFRVHDSLQGTLLFPTPRVLWGRGCPKPRCRVQTPTTFTYNASSMERTTPKKPYGSPGG